MKDEDIQEKNFQFCNYKYTYIILDISSSENNDNIKLISCHDSEDNVRRFLKEYNNGKDIYIICLLKSLTTNQYFDAKIKRVKH